MKTSSCAQFEALAENPRFALVLINKPKHKQLGRAGAIESNSKQLCAIEDSWKQLEANGWLLLQSTIGTS